MRECLATYPNKGLCIQNLWRGKKSKQKVSHTNFKDHLIFLFADDEEDKSKLYRENVSIRSLNLELRLTDNQIDPFSISRFKKSF